MEPRPPLTATTTPDPRPGRAGGTRRARAGQPVRAPRPRARPRPRRSRRWRASQAARTPRGRFSSGRIRISVGPCRKVRGSSTRTASRSTFSYIHSSMVGWSRSKARCGFHHSRSGSSTTPCGGPASSRRVRDTRTGRCGRVRWTTGRRVRGRPCDQRRPRRRARVTSRILGQRTGCAGRLRIGLAPAPPGIMIRATFPRRSAGVSGGELSHPVARSTAGVSASRAMCRRGRVAAGCAATRRVFG
jgi:hypothetical protein